MPTEPGPAAPAALACSGLAFAYPGDDSPLLRFPAFMVERGERACLVGPSGSGKSTLLMLIAGLLQPRSGTVEVAGTTIGALPGTARDRARGRLIGIVLQSFRLLPHLSVIENVMTAQYLSGAGSDRDAAMRTLDLLGIGALAQRRSGTLSRGQAQRAAIARAVVNRPALILADEPTSSLDDAAAGAALDLLQDVAASSGAALLVATHDRRARERIGRAVALPP